MSESPFLPDGRQFAWDSTSLNWAKECPRKYQIMMLQSWRPKEESIHLVFGLLLHSALETFDKAGRGENGLREAVRVCFTRPLPEHSVKTLDTLIRTVVWYCDKFRDDPCETVILANGKPAVELSGRLQIDDELVFSWHFDRLVNFSGSIFVQDRKSTSHTIGSYYFSAYDLDNQMSLYSLGSRATYQVPVKGVMIDAAQIAVGFSAFSRGFTYRTENQLEEWLRDAKITIHQIWEYQKADYFPMNDTSCSKYQKLNGEILGTGCPLRGICSKDPRIREMHLKSDFVQLPWNPLESR